VVTQVEISIEKLTRSFCHKITNQFFSFFLSLRPLIFVNPPWNRFKKTRHAFIIYINYITFFF